MPFKIIYDRTGNQFCGVNNFAKNLASMIKNTYEELPRKIVNIQYPVSSISYSLRLVLYGLMLRLFRPGTRIVVTLHEYKTSSRLRRITSDVLIKICHKLVVTNATEYNYLKDRKDNISIIPIFSNIASEPVNIEKTFASRKILLFGSFYPSRMITEIMTAFRQTENSGFELVVCGTPHSRHAEYYEQIKLLAEGRNDISLNIGMTDEQICALIQECFCGIGIYSDGLSSKRTSALLFYKAGLPFVSNCGENTEDFFVQDKNFCGWSSFKDVLEKLSDREYYSQISQNEQTTYAKIFANDVIISKYNEVIRSVGAK